jgi:hypothetical protein
VLWDSGDTRILGDIAVGEGAIHFATVVRADLALSIRSVPIDGGEDTLFLDIDPGLNARHLLRRGPTLFWTQAFKIMSSPVSAADPQELTDNYEISPNQPERLREVDGQLYWDSAASDLASMSASGGMVTELLTHETLVSFDVDSSGIYVIFTAGDEPTPRGIARVSSGGDIVEHIAGFADGVLIGPELVVDETRAYYFGVAAERDLLSVPKDGSAAPAVLIDDWSSYVADLAVSDGHLYFQEQTGRTSTLWRMPTTGGTPDALLSCTGDIDDIHLFGDHVYTTVSFDSGTERVGQIVRVER